MSACRVKRALISVSDKTGLETLAAGLVGLGVEIISTGGTFHALEKAGIPVTYISDVTHFPEILDGRVKTLHPAIHGGILAIRENPEHQQALADNQIKPIDMVVVNLYPFEAVAAKPDSQWQTLIENIDIGGPSMIRSAAKNHRDVLVVTDPVDYSTVLAELMAKGDCESKERVRLAIKAFKTTAQYDALITKTLQVRSEQPERSEIIVAEKVAELRYGENPGQKATLYKDPRCKNSFIDAKQLQGKALSYNNWLDSNSAFGLVQEFTGPSAVIVKHTNPCGVAVADTVNTAFAKALAADPISAFGGIVALNRPVDEALANMMLPTFWEVIIAPAFSAKAQAIFAQKKNLRLLEVSEQAFAKDASQEWRSINGGWLVQDKDRQEAPSANWQIVSANALEKAKLSDYELAWTVVKHVKSNAIVLVKDGATVGVGAGQMNRVGAAKIALEQAGDKAKGAVLGSDAFFPFGDTVELAAQYGVSGVIQPGGSIRDEESTIAADKHGMVMIHTGVRHFRH